MKKTEFLELALTQFLGQHPAWGEVVKDKRGLYVAAGREVPGVAFVYVDFSVRPDRFIAGHGVGWTTSLARFHEARTEKVNPPIQPRDGSLRRLLRLEEPRDFRYNELYVATAELCKPVGGFDLATESPDTVLATIASEIREYALPYLCLMFLKRHKLTVSVEQLSSSSIP